MQNTANESKLLGKVSKFKEPFKSIALRVHQIVMATHPNLVPSSMYGMPAYRNPETKGFVCLFRHDEYFTFSLLEGANYEFSNEPSGKMIPTAWFIKEMNDEVEKQLVAILKTAVK